MDLTVIVIGQMPDVVDDSFAVATNEDWARDYQIKINDDPVTIQANWKIFMQMQGAATGLLGLNASLENQHIVVTDVTAGKFGFRVRQADAAQVNPDNYYYDIVLVSDDGIYRLAKGTITVDKGITLVPGQEKWSHYPLILRP
jgi:hypothetical protein